MRRALSPMSPVESLPATAPVRRRRTAVAWILATVELFVAANAFFGGIELIRTGFGIPQEWLAGTIFGDWTWPGILLILTVGLPHVAAALAALIRTRYWPQIGSVAGVLAGASLLGWIGIQLAVIGHYFFLQPVIAVIGLVEIGLAAWWRRSFWR